MESSGRLKETYDTKFLNRGTSSPTWVNQYFTDYFETERAQTTVTGKRKKSPFSQASSLTSENMCRLPLAKQLISEVSPKSKMYQRMYLNKLINNCDKSIRETPQFINNSRQQQQFQSKYMSKWMHHLQMAQDLDFVPTSILTSLIQHLHYVNDTYKIESFLSSSEWKEGQYDPSKAVWLKKFKR